MLFITSSGFSHLKQSSVQKKVTVVGCCRRTLRVSNRKLVAPVRRRFLLVARGSGEDHTQQHSQWNSDDSDYFGRDPRKETEFWMEHAKEVLESKEVADAVEAHKKSGKTNLTEEQKAWLEFAKSITPHSENEE
ncbi:hypothetical protein GpartN1_g3529.t1 [Galdieria partita]|uniref:Uncharacterized protein n=1 Tax=Galdieria partita TaxID=83374 RepID=A0A9C7UQC1_9RHOD|nr:hypothetical protein GpartN1_g3529.t1 [Galdieria partita]